MAASVSNLTANSVESRLGQVQGTLLRVRRALAKMVVKAGTYLDPPIGLLRTEFQQVDMAAISIHAFHISAQGILWTISTVVEKHPLAQVRAAVSQITHVVSPRTSSTVAL